MNLVFRFRKAKKVLSVYGWRELVFRIFRTLYRSIPTSIRLDLQKYMYRFKGYCGVGEPQRVYNVSPEKIELSISRRDIGRKLSGFNIVGGNWDNEEVSKLEDSSIWIMLSSHFEEGFRWQETERYNSVVQRIKEGEDVKGLDSPNQTVSKYRDYLAYLDKVYESIENEGYKDQRKLSYKEDFSKRKLHPSLNEIQVFIGREGDIICESGIHRLCMAKILGIDEIPVRTQVRHKAWQKIRDEIFEASSVDELSDKAKGHLDHPELQDIVPREWKEE